MFTCEYCKKQFIANSTLRRHVRQFHKDAALPEVRRGRKPKQTSGDTSITCNICDERLVNKNAMTYHRKRKHEQTAQTASEKRTKSERRPLKFENFTDFNRWKCEEEDATLTQFVKATGDRKRPKQNMTSRAYYCNRSGRYIAKDSRLRHLKTQGTCKIGRLCPAAMFLKISSSGGVAVSYYPEHKGHSFDIAHIRLRREQREAIAAKLADGIPYDDILDSFHSNASASGISKSQLLSKRDLTNISRDFGINRDQVLRKNDAVVSGISSHQSRRNVHQLMSSAQLLWADIQSDVGDDVAAAEVVAEHMSRLRTLVKSLNDQTGIPHSPSAPPSREPVDKLATTQLLLRSTRRH